MLKKVMVFIVFISTVAIPFPSNAEQSLSIDGLREAIDILHAAGLTTYDNIEDFGAHNALRRDEAAKMAVEFFNQLDEKIISKDFDALNTECTFGDVEHAHSDLLTSIQRACELNLMRGFRNEFMPTRTITNGEFLAVTMRMMFGYLDESDTLHRAVSYLALSTEKNLLDQTNISFSTLDMPMTRGYAALLMKNIFTYLIKENTLKTNTSPDLSFTSVILDPSVSPPRVGDESINSMQSFINLGGKEVVLDDAVDIIRCTNETGAVVGSLFVNTYRLPAGASDGAYTVELAFEPTTTGKNNVFCVLDPDNYIAEANENNNSFVFEFYVEE